MTLRDKLYKKKQELNEKLQRGRLLVEQDRAEKLRRKQKKLSSMKPGVVKTVYEAKNCGKGVKQVMIEEYERRRQRRLEKYGKH